MILHDLSIIYKKVIVLYCNIFKYNIYNNFFMYFIYFFVVLNSKKKGYLKRNWFFFLVQLSTFAI